MMQMKKTCIIKNTSLDDVAEKNIVLRKQLHLEMMLMKKTCIIKNIAFGN